MNKNIALCFLCGMCNFVWSMTELEQEFTAYYEDKQMSPSLIDPNLGGSGAGSTIEATKDVRNYLVQFLQDHPEIKTFLDVGCGEGVWQELIPWEELGVQYIGVDVVRKAIEVQNIRSSNRTHMKFMWADITLHELPAADVCFSKDVLQHWSLTNQIKFVNRNQAKYPYFLTMNGYTETNRCFDPAKLPNSTAEFLGDFTDSVELKKLFWIKQKNKL